LPNRSPRLVQRYPLVKVGKNTIIGEFTTIGKPYRPVRGQHSQSIETRIGRNCWIGNYVTVGKGAIISDGCILDNYARIEENVFIGQGTRVIYGSHICNKAKIGRGCVIGGFVCERAILEDNVRTFGSLVHAHYAMDEWDEAEEEPSPKIGHDSVVSFGALVIGGVLVGPRSYVCAGAIVRKKNVSPRFIAWNVRNRIHYTKWKGELRKSPIFRGKI